MRIVIDFGKFRYNHLHMGMCTSGYIFRSKIDKLLGDIDDVKTHTDNILVLVKNCFRKHINS